MGIRYLNRFLKENASSAIRLADLGELANKKIAVDISIYMYRFASEGALIENMYLMLSVFKYYGIIPVFIFDGKPPPEKRELLKKRKEDKFEAEQEYNKLQDLLKGNNNMDENERQEILYNMDLLKRTFVNINKNDIERVKELIRAYGNTYYDAPGEADELCSLLVLRNKVWACLSEDMDMFLYGCPRVLRYMSLMGHTCVIYNTTEILNELGISQEQLREICVLSGTDYNIESDSSNTLMTTLKYFKKYHKSVQNTTNTFYEWLQENYDNVIKDYNLLMKINAMFKLENTENIDAFRQIKIMNGPIMKNNVKSILKLEGFLF